MNILSASTYFGIVASAIVVIVGSGCSDTEAPNETQPQPQTVCTPEELAQPPEDCDVPASNGTHTLQSWEDLRPFCESPCNRVNHLIIRSDSLTSLRPLLRIEKAVQIKIEHAPKLENLEGLNSLKEARFFWIDSWEGPKSLKGLDSLREVEELQIRNNRDFESTAGIESLETAEGIAIYGNQELTSLLHFDSLNKVLRLDVTDNPKLPQCQAEELAEQIDDLTYTEISGNASGSCD